MAPLLWNPAARRCRCYGGDGERSGDRRQPATGHCSGSSGDGTFTAQYGSARDSLGASDTDSIGGEALGTAGADCYPGAAFGSGGTNST